MADLTAEKGHNGTRRRMLDLFCCEGGMSSGYQRAGWEVYGLDMTARFAKRYPGSGFAHGDALAALRTLLAGRTIQFRAKSTASSARWLGLWDFDAIHASPPCQGYTRGNAGKVTSWPKLIPDVRALVEQTEKPYVIENVKDAGPEMVDPIALCGCMFDLSVIDYSCNAVSHEDRIAHVTTGACNKRDGVRVHLQRLRLFETNWGLTAPRGCNHTGHEWVAGAYGGARRDKYEAKYVRRGGYVPPDKEVVKALLGVEHDMTWNGLYECVPPRFAEHIGTELAEHIATLEAAA